jgi:hypothetical protein
MASVGSGHGHQQHRAQQLYTDDETTSVIVIGRAQSSGAPGDDTVHLELEAGLQVFDGDPQAGRQACFEIDPHSGTRNIVDDFYRIGGGRGVQPKFPYRLTQQGIPGVRALFDDGHASNP